MYMSVKIERIGVTSKGRVLSVYHCPALILNSSAVMRILSTSWGLSMLVVYEFLSFASVLYVVLQQYSSQ